MFVHIILFFIILSFIILSFNKLFDTSVDVFLGGSCNPTTWRKDVAIPIFEKLNVGYYNPQVDDWSPELIEKEADAKKKAKILLFVIDGMTRALTSILEAIAAICSGRRVVLVVNMVEKDAKFGDTPVTAHELEYLNDARKYLIAMAKAKGVPLYDTVEEACHACHSLRDKPSTHSVMAAVAKDAISNTKILFEIDGKTRAVDRILEATAATCSGRQVVLVVNMVKEGAEFDGKPVTAHELKDLNRVRNYLIATAKERGVPLYDTVEQACKT